jgi:hypothetical protein
MDQKQFAAFLRRARGEPDWTLDPPGDLVSVFCAECERWIDCHDGITPEVALERHSKLIH